MKQNIYPIFIQKVLGKTITTAWNGYGFVLYLEIKTPQEDWTLSIEGYWKMWKYGKLWIDSRKDSRASVDKKLPEFQNLTIHSIDYTPAKDTIIQLHPSIKLIIENKSNIFTTEIWSLVNHITQERFTAQMIGIPKYRPPKSLYSI